MGADQLPLPHLGPQARALLDRIVASGSAGVDRRDTIEWLLSRLIDLRYVEENPLDTSAFVSTSGGRHRWQIEMLADEQRAASAMRRQLIRYRVDERLSNLQTGPSTALVAAYPPMVPRLHGGVPEPQGPQRVTARLKPALAALFAASAVALVVFLGDTEPQDMQKWLSPPLHVAASPYDRPDAHVRAAAAVVAAPISAVVASARAARPAATSIEPPSHREWFGGIISLHQQLAGVLDRALAKLEREGSALPAIADVTLPVDMAIRNAAVTAAVLSDSTMSNTSQFGSDLIDGIKSSFRPIAAALLHATADVDRQVAQDVAPQPAPADVAAPILMPVDAEPAPPAPSPAPPVFVAQASPDQRPTTKAPSRASDTFVDPQHAMVERLNALSLAAARLGATWRPNAAHDVAALKPVYIP